MITIREVAKKAGVSIATVSRVLNKNGTCTAKTQENVYRAVSELGYTANLTAKSLKTGRTGNIGITIKSFYFINLPQILEAAMTVFHKQMFTTEVLTNIGLSECSARFKEGRYDGLLLVEPERDNRSLRELIETKKNFVLLGGETEREDVNLVEIDYFQGGYNATKQLLSLGHQDILFIDDNPSLYFTQEIKRGFLFALDESGTMYREDLLISCDAAASYDREFFGYRKLTEHLKSAAFTAVLTTDDRIASGVLKAARDAGIAIPEELSIIGFGDMSHSAYLFPPLTTVRSPAAQMGELGAEILVNNIRRNDGVIKRVKLKTQFIMRNTHQQKHSHAGGKGRQSS